MMWRKKQKVQGAKEENELENTRELLQIFVRRFGLLNASCCEQCCGEQVSLVQSHILYEIRRLANPSVQQAAEALGMDITTFSRQVKTLENKGLVEKNNDPGDRRIVILSLTAAGERVEGLIDQHMQQFIDRTLAQFSDFERETVIRSLMLLNRALSKSGGCC